MLYPHKYNQVKRVEEQEYAIFPNTNRNVSNIFDEEIKPKEMKSENMMLEGEII